MLSLLCPQNGFFVFFLLLFFWMGLGIIYGLRHPKKMPNHTFDSVMYPKPTKLSTTLEATFMLGALLLGISVCVYLIVRVQC